MNCNNYNTIKVTAGNAFSLLLPLKEKHYISEQPIEETINAALLTDVQVLLNNEEWSEFELGEDGVLVRFPSTLSKGVYNIELTAKYGGIAIRAAYFQCLSIVAWSYQSDAENYIPTSPLVADAAFVISVNGDEELTALKEQYRNAIAATEAEKAEYERKVAELNGVAQESTSQEILNEVSGIKGDNPNATNSAIYDAINAISPDLVQGKERLATAITSKGVETTSADSLYSMATKVIQIPQEVYNGVSGFEQMIAPTPYVWNIYRVATDLMSNELADYIPSYMKQYKSRYGANSFFVAEYQIADLSLILTGADGYLTSDGHFYSISNNMVVHTLPNGDVEKYSAEQIDHIWERNDYMNKWIAYYFVTDVYSYSVIEVICPNRVALSGTCNSFIVSGTNNLLEIWVLGSLGNFEGSDNGVWNNNQVLQGYENHASQIPIYSSLISNLCMPDLKHISGKLIRTLVRNDVIDSIYLPKLETLTNTPIVLSDASYTEINEIRLPKLRYIEVPVMTNKYQNTTTFNSIKHLCFDSLEEVNIKSFSGASGNGGVVGAFANCFLGLETLSLPNLKRITNGYVVHSYKIYSNFKPCFSNLIDIEVGEVETNLNLEYWIPLDVLAVSDNIPIINENIRNHIAAKVSDRTNNTALTVTFYKDLYNNLEQSTLDAFAEKNWIVAGK